MNTFSGSMLNFTTCVGMCRYMLPDSSHRSFGRRRLRINDFDSMIQRRHSLPARKPVEGKGVFIMIYKVLYIPGGAGCLPSTVFLVAFGNVSSTYIPSGQIRSRPHMSFGSLNM